MLFDKQELNCTVIFIRTQHSYLYYIYNDDSKIGSELGVAYHKFVIKTFGKTIFRQH